MTKKKRYSKLEILVLYEEQKSIEKMYPERIIKVRKKKYYTYRKRERYPRDESAYNKSQEEEFPIFIEYLEPAVDYVLDINLPAGSSFEYYTRLHDALICLSIKRYFGKSLRRSMGIIRYIVKREFPHVKVPCFKTLNNYQNNPIITFYADKIIEATSKPLSVIETRFTTDGTGEATFRYSTWYSIKAEKESRKKDHKIAEVTSTIILNAAVVVDVLDYEDPNLMRNHVEVTSHNFTIKHWSADTFYLTRDNCSCVRAKKAEAHIRIKSYTISNAKGSLEWKRTVTLQKNKNEKELDELNLRQNGEATNSAKKRKFGSYTLSINDCSQINDIKISWSCYNFSVLSRAYFVYGIIPEFLTHKFGRCFFRLGCYT